MAPREDPILCFQWTGGGGRGNLSASEFKAEDASPVGRCCSSSVTRSVIPEEAT